MSRIERECMLTLEDHFSGVRPKTLCGQVYFMQCGPDGHVKIGFTQNHIEQRFAAIQSHSPYRVKLIGLIVNQSRHTEQLLHGAFRSSHLRGEWFRSSRRLIEFVRKHRSSRTQIADHIDRYFTEYVVKQKKKQERRERINPFLAAFAAASI